MDSSLKSLVSLILLSLAFLVNCRIPISTPDVQLIVKPQCASKLICQICSKAKNISRCEFLLNRAPHSETANLTGLCLSAIDYTHFCNYMAVHAVLPTLKSRTNDSKLIRSYDACSVDFSKSMEDLGNANKSLVAQDYKQLQVQVAAGRYEVAKCHIAALELARLISDNGNFSDVILIIGDFLLKQQVVNSKLI